MRLRMFFTGLMVIAMLAGCDQVEQHSLKQPAMALGAQRTLPASIAGPKQNISLAHSVPFIPLQYALHDGDQVQLFSRGKWYGDRVNLYFLPASNLILHGHQYELKSAKGVQKVAEAKVRPDGTWYTVWQIGDFGIPNHQPFFILAKDTHNELGLIQINTRN